ncbi:hypothetical protein ACWDRR_06450 [Kitasatospora sp. NPDC003701]
MIRIRVTCDIDSVAVVVADLCRLWRVHDVKEYPARDPGQRRVYITASRRATRTR